MKRAAITFLRIIFFSSLLPAQTRLDATPRQFRAPDGKRAVVLPAAALTIAQEKNQSIGTA